MRKFFQFYSRRINNLSLIIISFSFIILLSFFKVQILANEQIKNNYTKWLLIVLNTFLTICISYLPAHIQWNHILKLITMLNKLTNIWPNLRGKKKQEKDEDEEPLLVDEDQMEKLELTTLEVFKNQYWTRLIVVEDFCVG